MAQTLLAYPSKVDLWWDAAQLEKHHGTHESLMAVLHDAVKHVPESEVVDERGFASVIAHLWLGSMVNDCERAMDGGRP